VVEPQTIEGIVQVLGVLAVRRQAEVGAKTLRVFARDLADAGFPVATVVEACDRIGRAERVEHETAFPDLGKLLRVCREVEADARRERQRQLAAQAPPLALPPADVEPLTREEAEAHVAQVMGWFKARVGASVAALRRVR
jgi:hypothetical protein